jgi:hypothetical protein
MRWRQRRLRASVTLQHGDRPLILCLGPSLTFELDVTEGSQLATELIDAIMQLRNGGGRE